MKKKSTIQMLPREKLTQKARAAIHLYTSLRGKKVDYLQGLMVDIVLKAERMRRADLYAYLEQRGYRWNGVYWIKKVTQ